MHNAAGGSLHRRVHNSIKSPTLGGGAAGCGRRRQEVTYLLHCGDHVIFFTDSWCRLLSPQTLFSSSSVSSMCVSPLFHRDIFIFIFYFCICYMLEASSTRPLTPGESRGDSLLCWMQDFYLQTWFPYCLFVSYVTFSFQYHSWLFFV